MSLEEYQAKRDISQTPEPGPEAGRPHRQNQVGVTHPEKVWFPDADVTKGEVFRFYQRIARRLLPYLKDRPCTLERLPDGLGGPDKPHFFQKDTPAHYPDWVPRVGMPTERGKTVRYVLVNDEQTLLYLVNQGTLTFHPWLSRVEDPDRPDFVLFDLDPGEAGFADVIAVARQVHSLLQAGGVKPFVKTSGKTGLHVLAPWSRPGGYEEARTWARGVAGQAVEALPERATLEVRKAKRGRRVYLDVLQNAKGHHAVPPYVVRAVAGAPVSTPLSWRELSPRLDPEQFNVRTIFRRLARQKRDPMAGLLAGARSG
jgi:bifunctional non-homologous end joining protein LigD